MYNHNKIIIIRKKFTGLSFWRKKVLIFLFFINSKVFWHKRGFKIKLNCFFARN